MRPLIADLFCCEGGMGVGLYRAGFDVVGVDTRPQPRYPFDFVQADALTFDLSGFDAVHASPPCQHDSVTHGRHKHIEYPRLIIPMRERLVASEKPWILENVVGAPMWHGVTLCGSMFGLPLRRHRRFDSSEWLYPPCPCRHGGICYDISGEKVRHWRAARDERTGRTEGPHLGVDAGRAIMGMPWASLHGLCEAVPPVYGEWIGRQLYAAVMARRAA